MNAYDITFTALGVQRSALVRGRENASRVFNLVCAAATPNHGRSELKYVRAWAKHAPIGTTFSAASSPNDANVYRVTIRRVQ